MAKEPRTTSPRSRIENSIGINASSLDPEIWEPAKNYVLFLLFVLVIFSFAAPAILAIILHIQTADGGDPNTWLAAIVRIAETEDGTLAPITDYWPAIPGLGAGIAVALPKHRIFVIKFIVAVMFLVAIASSVHLFAHASLDETRKAAQASNVLKLVGVADVDLDRFHGLVARTRDIAVAFISALVGGYLAATQQRLGGKA